LIFSAEQVKEEMKEIRVVSELDFSVDSERESGDKGDRCIIDWYVSRETGVDALLELLQDVQLQMVKQPGGL
jgi:hypothetical protein